ncbi:MAG: hypothetical protein JNJ47_01215 [Alphaproteobacteria bacterium]|nr:hypothetical protein [Alphaproteobacteria bacterium]
MLNIKTITLVTGLASLVYHPQAWAMNEEEFKDSGNAGSVPVKPASKTQEAPSDVETQLEMERLRNEKLVAQIQLEEERRKTAELQARLAALQVSPTSTPAPAPTPTLSDAYKTAEHGLKKRTRILNVM